MGCPSWPAASQPCPLVCLCCRYTGTTPSPPPGSHYTSPSENMWNTGSTYNLSSGMAVAGERPHEGGTGALPGPSWGSSAPDMASHPLTSPSLCTGMPTAYDLSSVIAGGSSVGHNNLIPLGECPPGSGSGGVSGHGCLGLGLSAPPSSSSLPSLPGAPGGGPVFRSSLPHSAAAAPTLPTP